MRSTKLYKYWQPKGTLSMTKTADILDLGVLGKFGTPLRRCAISPTFQDGDDKIASTIDVRIIYKYVD